MNLKIQILGHMEMFIAVINSYVHIMMYFYYFMSSFKRYRAITNRIKPMITIIQITQLTLILGQCVAIAFCEESNINYVLVGNFIVNIVLFSHFFIRTYLCKSKIRSLEINNNAASAENGKINDPERNFGIN